MAANTKQRHLSKSKKVLLQGLRYDPFAPLIQCGNIVIETSAKGLLTGRRASVDMMQIPEAASLIAKQRPDGSWLYPTPNLRLRSRTSFNQLETYRNLGILVEKFNLNKKSPVIQHAAQFLFSFQTNEGDFRGIYGNQVSPNYSAAIGELLIKAGYRHDDRIRKLLRWLISIRQDDGGWAIPFRTKGYPVTLIYTRARTVEADKSAPFSAMVTGVVLRIFAAHGGYKNDKAIRHAGKLLQSSLFTTDNYPDRAGKESWLRFNFPFWYTDLISALDTLSLLGFSPSEGSIATALRWLSNHQQPDGLWRLRLLKGRNKSTLQLFHSLAIVKIFKRFSSKGNK